MPNRKFTTARAAAFWIGLTLHLALGAALYQHVTDQNSTQVGSKGHTLSVDSTTAKP